MRSNFRKISQLSKKPNVVVVVVLAIDNNCYPKLTTL